MRTRIKICGFTRVDDALAAAQAGVDAIGLVFYARSPRHVSIEQAQAIVQALPAFVTVVGLFVNEQEHVIHEVLRYVPLDCLQFHGEESPQACERYGKRYIKAVRMLADTDLQQIAQDYASASGLLLDAFHPTVQGGTGQTFDWQLIPQNFGLPLILAGGLTIENAVQAIQQCKPYALDVSSGVEQEKGIKDPAKMTAFIQQVKRADNHHD